MSGPSVVFMGRKPGAVVALAYLLERQWSIPWVIAPEQEAQWLPRPTLGEAARDAGLAVVSYPEFLDRMPSIRDVDWVFSYLFPYRVCESVLALPSKGALNFHPAPLPEYGGLGGYNFAILEGREEYGVTCHYMDESFDTGDLVQVDRFPVDRHTETAVTLEARSQRALLRLFARLIERIEAGEDLPRKSQEGRTRYIDREEFEGAKIVRWDDDVALIERKIRAFWYPPYEGAKLQLGDGHVTLANAQVLGPLAAPLHRGDLAHLRSALRELTHDS